jgi:hypothetical protein
MKPSSSRRVRYSPEQRAAWVNEFRGSGETQQTFARRRGIKWTTFRNWLYRRSGRMPARPSAVGFQEIQIAALRPPAPWGAEIALEGGTVVRLQAGADPQWVQAILQPLRQPC